MNDAIKQFNQFIQKWCGENAAHLLDNDENDGERMRGAIRREVLSAVDEAALIEHDNPDGYTKRMQIREQQLKELEETE